MSPHAAATRARVFVNPNARGGAVDRLRDAVARVLGDRAEVVETNSPTAAREAVCRACDQDRLVVAAGGDGTVHAVINAVMACPERATVGLLPMGTSNNFCRDLGLPLELDAALGVLRDGVAEPVDLLRIEADGAVRYGASIATAGNADRVIEALTEEDKTAWGAWCYLRAALPVMADLETYGVRVTIDGEPTAPYRLWNLLVANGRYAGGGLDVAPEARLDDGLLEVILIEEGDGLDLAGLASDFLRDDYRQHDRVTWRQAREARIEADKPLRLLVDGELVEGRTLHFRVEPAALRVVTGG